MAGPWSVASRRRWLTAAQLFLSATATGCGGSVMLSRAWSRLPRTGLEMCYFCHEITERTSDGDRVTCLMCGRPYLVTVSSPDAAGPQSPDLTPHGQTY